MTSAPCCSHGVRVRLPAPFLVNSLEEDFGDASHIVFTSGPRSEVTMDHGCCSILGGGLSPGRPQTRPRSSPSTQVLCPSARLSPFWRACPRPREDLLKRSASHFWLRPRSVAAGLGQLPRDLPSRGHPVWRPAPRVQGGICPSGCPECLLLACSPGPTAGISRDSPLLQGIHCSGRSSAGQGE